jgi:hypothetical protein
LRPHLMRHRRAVSRLSPNKATTSSCWRQKGHRRARLYRRFFCSGGGAASVDTHARALPALIS